MMRQEAVWHSEFGETLDYIYEDTLQDQLNGNERAGVLTMLGFLNSHSKLTHPSPVLRGVFVQERFLCTPPPPPPGDVPRLRTPTMVKSPGRTESVMPIIPTTACFSCHDVDGIGFTFENYDGLGQWRDNDNDYPVDASGKILNTDVDGLVQNAVAMTKALSQSKTVHQCHVKQWFVTLLGEVRPI